MACGIVYVKVAGVWKPIDTSAGDIFAKVTGAWKVVDNVYVKAGGVWHNTFCEVVHGTITYNVPGIYNFVVPNGVTNLDIVMSGGGGGGGGFGLAPGPTAGLAGEVKTVSMAVTPGNNVSVYVGAGGAGGRAATGNCGGNGANFNALDGCCGGGEGGFGYTYGGNRQTVGCFWSFTPSGGWGGGGGGSSAADYPAGPTLHIAGGGTGGNNGQNAFVTPVVLSAAPGGNPGTGDGSFAGSAGGAVSCAGYDCGYGVAGTNGFVTITW